MLRIEWLLHIGGGMPVHPHLPTAVGGPLHVLSMYVKLLGYVLKAPAEPIQQGSIYLQHLTVLFFFFLSKQT